MEREVSLDEISDGKLYGLNDMVKAGCQDCEGCSACCRGMGQSIVLDPLDIHRLAQGLGKSFEQLLSDEVELHVEQGVILPNVKMAGVSEVCPFLNEGGRCRIHPFRPGLCRLFPLGRYYLEDGSFLYFLQTSECRRENRSKIKVRRWLDTADLQANQKFVEDWHKLIKSCQGRLREETDGDRAKSVNLLLLEIFYQTPYSGEEDFYRQFAGRAEIFMDKTGENV